jgi:hypothetical protein
MSNVITIELGRDEVRDSLSGLVTRPGNASVLIEPLEESRRGRWRKNQHMPPEARTDPKIAHAPEELPGYHVSLDIKARSVRVFDPLQGSDEGEHVSAVFRDRLGRRLDIERTIERTGLSKQQLWSWAKWMFRANRDKDAKLIEGEFPPSIAKRLEEERRWDQETDHTTGKKQWHAEPELV